MLAGDAPFEESEEQVLLEHFYTIFNQVLDSPVLCLWVRNLQTHCIIGLKWNWVLFQGCKLPLSVIND